MWKKRFIIFVTFIAGLYFFLEFLVPPTVPWATNEGIVQSIDKMNVVLSTFKQKISYNVDAKTKINRTATALPGGGDTGNISTNATSVLDKVKLPSGDNGVVINKNNIKLVVGVLSGTKTIAVQDNLRAARSKSNGTVENNLELSTIAPNDLVKIGPTTYLTGWLTDMSNFVLILTYMALGLGLFNLWMMHQTAIRKRQGEWYLSILFFIGLPLGLLAGYANGITPETATEFQKNWHLIALNKNIQDYVIFPFGSTVFSLLSFYLASAAYRSFKAKSREAVLMMVSALIVMLGQIPFGLAITKWLPQCLWMPVISQWLQMVLNTAVVRGLWFGMMLGIIAIGLRFWLSLERGAFFDKEL